MDLLVWNAAWETGVPLIDTQHRELFVRIEKVFRSIRAHGDEVELERAMDFLRDYVETHFRSEEALMEQRAYPERAYHQLVHQRMKVLVGGVAAGPPGAPRDDAMAVMDFFTEWLVSHICEDDRRLADFLKEAERGAAARKAKGMPEPR